MTSIDIDSSAQAIEQDLLLIVRNLTVLTPDGKRILIGGLNPLSSSSSSYSAEDTMQQEHATQGIDFSLRAADRLLIVGPSGAVSEFELVEPRVFCFRYRHSHSSS